MENCAAAGLAIKGVKIPRHHPAKIARFTSVFELEEATKILRKWLAKRARAQYVDFNASGKLRVPHQEFNESDAKEALKDCQKVIMLVKKALDEPLKT